jgi:hypothetical protein
MKLSLTVEDGLWHTEWGYSTVRAKSDKHQAGLSEETQAVYILRPILESDAIGIEHTFIYDFKDDGVNPYSDYDNFGLIKNDRSPKQSYFAVQRVTGLLAECERWFPKNRPRSKVIPPSKRMAGASMLYVLQVR